MSGGSLDSGALSHSESSWIHLARLGLGWHHAVVDGGEGFNAGLGFTSPNVGRREGWARPKRQRYYAVPAGSPGLAR
jgi:hypothetical protein